MGDNDQIRIIVIGTSMGGLRCIKEIAKQLKAEMPIAVFIVQHLFEDVEPELPFILSNLTDMKVKVAEDDEEIKPGTIYVNSSNQHLLICKNKVVLGEGERENGSRPSINNLFRSAAVAYKERVIGILMTGLLSDGTAGLKTIKEHGGITIVQDPDEAEYKEMPANAIKNVDVHYITSIEDLGALLRILFRQEIIFKEYKANKELLKTIEMAALKTSEYEEKLDVKKIISRSTRIDNSLITAIQVMQAQSNMLQNMAESEIIKGNEKAAKAYLKRAAESGKHTENLRKLLEKELNDQP
ncbi:MAG: chemotaxis protein CheB [Candidatus Cyclobacteriaceae bacterium M2_1C_046]